MRVVCVAYFAKIRGAGLQPCQVIKPDYQGKSHFWVQPYPCIFYYLSY